MQLQQHNINSGCACLLAKDDYDTVTLLTVTGEIVKTTAFVRLFGVNFQAFLITFDDFLVIDNRQKIYIARYFKTEDTLVISHRMSFKLKERVHKVTLYDNIYLFVCENTWTVADISGIIYYREKFWHERIYLHNSFVFIVTHNTFLLNRALGASAGSLSGSASSSGSSDPVNSDNIEVTILSKNFHSVEVFNLSGVSVHKILNADIGPDSVLVCHHFLSLTPTGINSAAINSAAINSATFSLKVINTQDGQVVADLNSPAQTVPTDKFAVISSLADYIIFIPCQLPNGANSSVAAVGKPHIMTLTI